MNMIKSTIGMAAACVGLTALLLSAVRGRS
jgi:hypothetical protein